MHEMFMFTYIHGEDMITKLYAYIHTFIQPISGARFHRNLAVYTHIHTYMMHACMHAHIQPTSGAHLAVHTRIHTHSQSLEHIWPYIHAYIHTANLWSTLSSQFGHMYTHTCMHTYSQSLEHASIAIWPSTARSGFNSAYMNSIPERDNLLYYT